MPGLLLRLGSVLALQALALVLAHDVVFMARYGSRFGEALVHSGHGETWSAAVGTTVVLAGLLAFAAAARLLWLGALVRRSRAAFRGASRRRAGAGGLDDRSLLRAWVRVGSRIALGTLLVLTIQENLEHGVVDGATPGLGILLSPEYPNAIAITIAVSFLVGLVAALFEWRLRALIRELRAARAAWPRARSATRPRMGLVSDRPGDSILGRRSGLRAPPLPASA